MSASLGGVRAGDSYVRKIQGPAHAEVMSLVDGEGIQTMIEDVWYILDYKKNSDLNWCRGRDRSQN